MQHEALLLLVVPAEQTESTTLEEVRKNYPFIHASECEILARFVSAGVTYESLRKLVAVDYKFETGRDSVYWSALCDATEDFLSEYLNAIAKLEGAVLTEVEPPPLSKLWVDVIPHVETLEILLRFLRDIHANLHKPLVIENFNEDGSALTLSGSAALLQRVYDAAIRSAGARARPMFALCAAVHRMLFLHLQAWMREGRVPVGGEDLFPAITLTPTPSKETDFAAASFAVSATQTSQKPPASAPVTSTSRLPAYFPRAVADKVVFVGRARVILNQNNAAEHLTVADSSSSNNKLTSVWQRFHRALVTPTAVFSILEVEEIIEELHREAAARLWSRLTELQLPRHLDALYQFALGAKGDLWTVFVDSLIPVLSTVPRPLNLTKELASILNKSAAATAFFEEDEWLARVRLTWQPPATRTTDAVHPSASIHFDYHIESPLDILLTDDAIQSYRKAFAGLLRVRWQQQELHNAWQLLTRFCKRTRGKIPDPVQYACRLRNKIAGFVDILQQHLQVEVVEVQHRKLRTALTECTDFASAQKAHATYLAALVAHNPASHPRLQPPVDALLQLAAAFCTALQSIAAPSPTIDVQHLRQIEREFDRYFGLLYALLSRLPAAWAVLLSGKMYNATRFLQTGVLPTADGTVDK